MHYVGHPKNYEHILVVPPASGENLLGQNARVRIIEISKFYMKGVLVDDIPSPNQLMLNNGTIKQFFRSPMPKILLFSQALIFIYFVIRYFFDSLITLLLGI